MAEKTGREILEIAREAVEKLSSDDIDILKEYGKIYVINGSIKEER